MVPGLLTDQQEGQDLEGQAGEDLGEDREEQRARDQPTGGALRHQLPPGRVQAHWGGEEPRARCQFIGSAIWLVSQNRVRINNSRMDEWMHG